MLRNVLLTLIVGFAILPLPPSVAQSATEHQRTDMARTVRGLNGLSGTDQEQLRSWIRRGVAAVEAKPVNVGEVRKLLTEGDAVLNGPLADVQGAWVTYGSLALIAGDQTSKGKAVSNLVALGADQSSVPAIISLLKQLREPVVVNHRALTQTAAPAATQPVVEHAPLPARTARTVASLATEEQNRLTKWIQSALSALEAPPSDNAKALAALQEGEGLLTGQSADVIEAWGAYGMLGQRLNNADAQSKALNNLVALGADRSQVQGLRDLIAVLQASAPKPAPATAPSATPAPAAQPQPTPAQPAEDAALARRTARKALLDGLKALPRDDANRASLDALTAMVERAVAADRTLTRLQERTLIAIVQEMEQVQDEQAKASKQAELVVALADALATAPDNPRHWAMLVNIAIALPAEQVVTIDLGQQHKLTANPEVLLRGSVVSLELLGAENNDNDLVIDALLRGKRALVEADRKAALRAEEVRLAAEQAKKAAAEQARQRAEAEAQERQRVAAAEAAQKEAALIAHRKSPWATSFRVGEIRKLAHNEPVLDALFSPNGSKIVTLTNPTAFVWDTESGTQLNKVYNGSDHATVLFTKDEKQLLLGRRSGSVRIIDNANGKEVREINSDRAVMLTSAFGSPRNWVSFSSDGSTLLSISTDEWDREWAHLYRHDFRTGRQIRKDDIAVINHDADITSVDANAECSVFVSGSKDNTVKVWKFDGIRLILYRTLHIGADVEGVKLIPSAQRVLVAGKSGLSVWDFEESKQILTLDKEFNPGEIFACSHDGRFVATRGRRWPGIDITIWDAASGQRLRTLSVTNDNGVQVNSLEFSPDNRLLLIGLSDETARIWGATE